MFVKFLHQFGDIDSLGKQIAILMNDLFWDFLAGDALIFHVFWQEEVLMDEASVCRFTLFLSELGELGRARVLLLTDLLDAWVDLSMSCIAVDTRQNLIIGFERIRFQIQVKLLLSVE